MLPQKGFAPIFVTIGILLALSVAGVIYYVSQQTTNKLVTNEHSTPTSIPSSSPILDPTVSWQTHTNSDYHYQLKYPKDLKTYIPENATQVFLLYLNEKKDEYVEIEIGGISSLGLKKEIEFDMQRANPIKTTFLNRPAVIIRPARNIYPGEPFKAMIIYSDNFKLEVGYYGAGKNEQLFDQIVSTISFTSATKPIFSPKPVSSNGSSQGTTVDVNSTTKEYYNAEYKIRFRYPASINLKRNNDNGTLLALDFSDGNNMRLQVFIAKSGGVGQGGDFSMKQISNDTKLKVAGYDATLIVSETDPNSSLYSNGNPIISRFSVVLDNKPVIVELSGNKGEVSLDQLIQILSSFMFTNYVSPPNISRNAPSLGVIEFSSTGPASSGIEETYTNTN